MVPSPFNQLRDLRNREHEHEIEEELQSRDPAWSTRRAGVPPHPFFAVFHKLIVNPHVFGSPNASHLADTLVRWQWENLWSPNIRPIFQSVE
jgi:hypothetical protein